MQQVTYPVRYMKEHFGIDTLILTNAAGGINQSFDNGTLMVIKDHISSFVPSPLLGLSEKEYGGKRFPDMSSVYNESLRLPLKKTANEEGVKVREGIYLQTTGPNYETPAEVRMYGLLGADAVGMSTAVEALLANALGIKVCGISCITNKAAGLSDQPLSHEEVQETANRVSKNFTKLLLSFIRNLSEESESEDTQLKVFTKKTTELKVEHTEIDTDKPDFDGIEDIDYSKGVIIYSDGSARGNPDGPGGYGTHLEYTKLDGTPGVKEFFQGFVRTTNNRMEILGAIVGLEALKKPCKVTIYSDSQYLIKTFTEHWIDGWIKKGWMRGKNEPVKNVDLWKRMLNAKMLHDVTFVWVKGHNGHPQNERCDFLATSAADGKNLLTDNGVDL